MNFKDEIVKGIVRLIDNVKIQYKEEKELFNVMTDLNRMQQAIEQLQITITNYVKTSSTIPLNRLMTMTTNLELLFQLQDDLNTLTTKIEQKRKQIINKNVK